MQKEIKNNQKFGRVKAWYMMCKSLFMRGVAFIRIKFDIVKSRFIVSDNFTVDLNAGKIEIIGMIRMRNESLILQDTLNHLSQFVDGVVIYDDVSTDNSVQIAKKHPVVLHIIEGKKWNRNRVYVETKHRQELLKLARKYNPKWMFYADCDERFDGNIKDFLRSDKSNGVDAVRIRLFDAYITQDDQKDYHQGDELYGFRKYFGPEYRDILMIWRNMEQVVFDRVDAREPTINSGRIITKFYCQHYGKSISKKQWDDTCIYYMNNFPEPYYSKWKSRFGHAVHTESDFGNKLYTWNEVKKMYGNINN